MIAPPLYAVEKRRCGDDVVDLAAGENEAQWPAEGSASIWILVVSPPRERP